jgi:hypothetical protein
LPGCDTTPASSKHAPGAAAASNSAARTRAATSGVPRKTTRPLRGGGADAADADADARAATPPEEVEEEAQPRRSVAAPRRSARACCSGSGGAGAGGGSGARARAAALAAAGRSRAAAAAAAAAGAASAPRHSKQRCAAISALERRAGGALPRQQYGRRDPRGRMPAGGSGNSIRTALPSVRCSCRASALQPTSCVLPHAQLGASRAVPPVMAAARGGGAARRRLVACCGALALLCCVAAAAVRAPFASGGVTDLTIGNFDAEVWRARVTPHAAAAVTHASTTTHTRVSARGFWHIGAAAHSSAPARARRAPLAAPRVAAAHAARASPGAQRRSRCRRCAGLARRAPSHTR